MSLVTGSKRTATCIAKTDVEVITFAKEDFLSILRGNSETIEFLLNLSKRRLRYPYMISDVNIMILFRQEPSWQVISANSAFSRMTNSQKTRLQALLHRMDITKDSYVWKASEDATMGFLVAEGCVR
jgi:CRP-like cAMP-binding protein